MEGFPMRSWSIEICLLDEHGQEILANVFEKAVYNLHPSFERPKQSMKLSPSMNHSATTNAACGQPSKSRHSGSKKKDGENSICRLFLVQCTREVITLSSTI